MSRMSAYVETFDNNKLMPFHIDDGQILEKYKAIYRSKSKN